MMDETAPAAGVKHPKQSGDAALTSSLSVAAKV